MKTKEENDPVLRGVAAAPPRSPPNVIASLVIPGDEVRGASETLTASNPAEFRGTPRFHVQRLIGRGGMGIVYHVHDRELGQDVALKTMQHVSATEVYRLKSEFRSLSDISHPNLVRLYELFWEGDSCYFTMELIEGVRFTEYVAGADPTLGSTMEANSPRLERLRPALQQLVVGVAALHDAGKLHRDIKPSNVMVAADGRVVVLDFGLVVPLFTHAHGPLVSIEGIAGTPAYMAPEQAWGTGPLTPAADWYSVGVLLFEALTGRLPFDGTTPEVLLHQKVVARPAPSSFAGVTDAFDKLVIELLDPDPWRRPGADAILAALAPPSMTEGAIPAATTFAAESPFVGREDDLARLGAIFTTVKEGRTAVVHLQGSSGIGKSTLVRRFLSSLGIEPRIVALSGRCHPTESVPYKAFDELVDALSHFLIGLSRGEVDALAPRYTSALLRLFPVLARVTPLARFRAPEPDLEPRELRRRGFVAFRELLTRIAERRPLVLWIDDLQWGEPDSALLLRELLLPPDAPPLMMVLSYRTEDIDQSTLLRAVRDDTTELLPEGTYHIALRPLDRSESRRLVARLFGSRDMELEPFVPEIDSEAAGSPFLIGLLVRHLILERSRHHAGRAQVSDFILDRLGSLTESERGILEIVSIAGGPVDRSVALRAAASGEPGRIDVVRLGHLCALRTIARATGPAIETYHDRIREAVVSRLDPDARRARHRALADALRATPDPDPETLVQQYLGAGDRRSAHHFATLAGSRAASSLAFDRAATCYRLALELTGDAPARWFLHSQLAEALANSGRGGEAAEHFQAAAMALAATSPDDENILKLKRQAAEHYIRCGRVDEGLVMMRSVLNWVGVSVPRSQRLALLASLVNRARFVLRGVDFKPKVAATRSPAAVMRLDAMWGAATSLSMMDVSMADSLGTRHLLEALQLGEPSRAARALGFEAAFEAIYGGRFFRQRSERMLAIVDDLAENTGEPYDRAWSRMAKGIAAWGRADWATCVSLCDEAGLVYRAQCRGVAWELAVVELYTLSGLAFLGRMRELHQRIETAIGDAQARADLFAANNCRLGQPSVAWLAADRPDVARAHAAQAQATWPDGTHNQRYYHVIGCVQTELYADAPWAALRFLLDSWPMLRAGQFLRLSFPRLELHHLRARAALAAAASLRSNAVAALDRDPSWTMARLLDIATRDERRIRGGDLPPAAPYADLIEAGVSRLQERPEKAASALTRAVSGFDAAAMAVHREAARRRLGFLIGGNSGALLVRQSDNFMGEQGIRNPERMTAMIAPACGAEEA